MNTIVNKILLIGDKFMPEMYLKKPGFMYSACGLFTRNKERIKKFKEIEIYLRYKLNRDRDISLKIYLSKRIR